MNADAAVFGFVYPQICVSVDRYPAADTGAFFSSRWRAVGGDSSYVGVLLAQWGVNSVIMGNDLGDDELGHETIEYLKASQVRYTFGPRSSLSTPLGLMVSDQQGTRNWYLEDNQAVKDTLEEVDLSPIKETKFLYVDWYAGYGGLRACKYAMQSHVPIYLNVEGQFEGSSVHSTTVETMLSTASYCQVTWDRSQGINDVIECARRLQRLGPETIIFTGGARGCVAIIDNFALTVSPPPTSVRDTNGAGATFSAAVIHCLNQGKDIRSAVRWATAIASFKCERNGIAGLDLAALEERYRGEEVSYETRQIR